jgi:hypothetical protein
MPFDIQPAQGQGRLIRSGGSQQSAPLTVAFAAQPRQTRFILLLERGHFGPSHELKAKGL